MEEVMEEMWMASRKGGEGVGGRKARQRKIAERWRARVIGNLRKGK